MVRQFLARFGEIRRIVLDVGLLAIAAISLFQVLVSAGLIQPIFSIQISSKIDVFYDISVGYIVSYGFYILVVVIPEFKARRDLRDWLIADYRRFKLGLIEIYLSAIGDPWESDLAESLLEASAFSEYFGARYSQTQTRWHAVHNGLYSWGLLQIIVECEIFVRELQFARLRAKEVTSIPLEKLNAISRLLTRVRTSQPDYDDIKLLLLALFPIHCPWDILEGGLARDSISESIAKL